MNAHDAIVKALDDLVGQESMFTHYDVTKYARSFTDDNVRHGDVVAYVSRMMDEDSRDDDEDFATDDYVVDVVDVEKNVGVPVQAVLYRPYWENSSAYDQDAIQTDKSLGCGAGGSCGCSVSKPTNPIIAKASQAAAKAAAVVKKFQNPAAGGPASTPAPASTPITDCGPTSGVLAPVPKPALVGNPIPHKTTGSKLRDVAVDNRGRVCIPKEFIDRIGAEAGDLVQVHKSSVKGLVTIAAIKWAATSHTHLGQYQVDCYGNVRIPRKVLSQCNVRNVNGVVKVRSEQDHIVIE